MGLLSRSARRRSVLLLAALAYLPLVLRHAGRLPADTKLGLSLDPWRLMTDSVASWDTAQFAGWVPHQAISYLWPSGPFYWLATTAGLPPWLVQRLFAGTVLLAAGLGVRWLLLRRGFGASAALVAALVYQSSPYVLPYVSRTSLMLLPWAGLPWLVGLAQSATAQGRGWWRPTAAFGLVVATVGGINLTAIAMVAPGPLLALWASARSGETSWGRATIAALRLGAVSVAVSLWWLAMLAVQGRYGADVLGYSETIEAVSSTSTATEVLRGMGYWLAYIDAPSGATTTAALPYTTAPWLVAAGSGIVVAAVIALATLRFRERALAGALVLVGTVLAVGVHPISDPSPLMTPIAGDTRSTLALALRSSTRAIPLLLLGLAMCIAALVHHSARWRTSLRTLVPITIAALAVVNLPALFTGDIVDPGLLHDESPPAEWLAAARRLDQDDSDTRVLQLPGIESQAFSWGYTVDPPLAWLTDRPLVTRDWLPLGSPALMDLLYSFDDRFQSGVAESGSVAAVGRLLGVGTIWSARDIDWEKFGTASPTDVERVLAGADDITIEPDANEHVAQYRIAEPAPIVRVGSRTVVVHGSGDGLVDAAAAGLLDGTEAIVYAADLSDAELAELIAGGATVILTDSNRDRARQWRGSQDVVGFTEVGDDDADVINFDPQDARLPVFGDDTADDRTIATLDDLAVRATSYGSHLRLLPEHRPAMAVDGDETTAWLVGVDAGPTIGARIVISGHDGALRLRQPEGWSFVTRIEVRQGSWMQVLDLRTASDVVELEPDGDGDISITISAVSGPGPVGFSELLPDAHPETVRVPLLRVTTPGDAFAAVLTRLRAGEERRRDVEITLRRSIETPPMDDPRWKVTIRDETLEEGCTDDLIVVDGQPFPLRIDETDAAEARRGAAVELEACRPAPLAGGRHEIVGGRGVDRIVIAGSDTARTSGDAAEVVVSRGGSSHDVRIDGCIGGCWLIFGEGYSDGWSASSDDATIGRHLPISGGANGWWVEPTNAGAALIHLQWSGQRPVTAAGVASLIVVVGLIAVVLVPRRWRINTRRASASVVATSVHERNDIVSILLGTLATLAVAVVTVGPAWAIPTIVVATSAVILRRRELVAWAGALAVTGIMGLLCLRMVTHRRVPDFAWPLQFERLHRPLLFAIVLVTVAAVTERPRHTEQRTHHR